MAPPRGTSNSFWSLAVPTIIFINLLVFVAWVASDNYGTDSLFMIENFLVSWTAIERGRIWTLITSAFSHNMFWHFFLNMYVLNSFGVVIERLLGFRRFLKFYLIAGIVSSLSHALVSAFIMDKPDLPALGASGAISGIVLLFSLLFPKQKILILALIPIPAIWGAILLVGIDLWGLIAQAGGGGLPIGHGAHLGGAFAGFIYYLFYSSSRRR